MLSDDARRAPADVPLDELEKKARLCNPDPFAAWRYERNPNILQARERALLVRFARSVWLTALRTSKLGRADMRLVVPKKCLVQLFPGSNRGTKLWNECYRHFFLAGGRRGKHKLVLRVTTSPSNACIDFHCDEPHASSTSQISLNDDYEGGRIFFYNKGRLRMPEHPAGSIIQYRAGVFYGVSAVTKGTRYSLFIMDKTNDLGDKGVTIANRQHVANFLAEEQVRVSKVSLGDPSSREQVRQRQLRHPQRVYRAKKNRRARDVFQCMICNAGPHRNEDALRRHFNQEHAPRTGDARARRVAWYAFRKRYQ